MHCLAFVFPLCTTPHVQEVWLHTFQNRMARYTVSVHTVSRQSSPFAPAGPMEGLERNKCELVSFYK